MEEQPTTHSLSQGLHEWYEDRRSAYPFRQKTAPYTTWLSEIMLQQTRMEAALPRFLNFIKLFPDIQSLAEAPEEQVLQAWQGLGYYNRARNLHRAARILNRDGIPRQAAEWQELPGIGPYTAAAIASICFGEQVQVNDGNIRRIACRIRGADLKPAACPEVVSFCYGEEHSWGDTNQALMDLGRLVCTPRKPDCPACPLQPVCQAARDGNPEDLPVKKNQLKIDTTITFLLLLRRKQHAAALDAAAADTLFGSWKNFQLAAIAHTDEDFLKGHRFPPWYATFAAPSGTGEGRSEPASYHTARMWEDSLDSAHPTLSFQAAFRHSITRHRIVVDVKVIFLPPESSIPGAGSSSRKVPGPNTPGPNAAADRETQAGQISLQWEGVDWLKNQMTSSLGKKLYHFLEKNAEKLASQVPGPDR
jgi:A/G-specific adenine glycosylase